MLHTSTCTPCLSSFREPLVFHRLIIAHEPPQAARHRFSGVAGQLVAQSTPRWGATTGPGAAAGQGAPAAPARCLPSMWSPGRLNLRLQRQMAGFGLHLICTILVSGQHQSEGQPLYGQPSGASRERPSASVALSFSHRNLQDAGLASLIGELGGRVVSSVQEAAPGMAVVALHEGQDDGCGSGDDPWGSIGVNFLLRSILTMDMAPVRQLVNSAREVVGRGAPLTEAASPNPADSDMTQAAEDEDVEMEAADRTTVVPRSGPSNDSRVSMHQVEPGSGRVGASTRLAGGKPHELDGWMVAARHPDDGNPQAVLATTVNHMAQQPFTEIVHEDAPPPKRRRLIASNAAKPSNCEAGIARPTIVQGTAEVTNQFSCPSPPSAPPSLLPSLDTIKHEPVDDGSWMSQQPHRRDSRRNGARLRVPITCTAVTVKEEPMGLPPSGGPLGPGYAITLKKAKASKAAAVEELDQLGLRGRVKEETLPVEVLDASAQVVLEADLFAPTPEQPSPQFRISSAELLSGSSGMVDAAEVMGLPDFKQFRKQGGQLPCGSVQPLPVFLVDNFQRTEETETFLRLQEERANNKRRADEMFKNADVGSKRPSRGPRRA
ncbi:hypothetical protein Vafri_7438 [Volvox africanus]|uniref:Uncharacterized protein n=1 Tax=Volvox africanus TaxID=51714 RepID=A0A8J4B0K8_9CHLO|nr:hypothetical protein Vafri_7438 [Volvox africanus]